MADLVLLKDIAMVISADQYKKSVRGSASSRSIRRIEFPVKVPKNVSTVSVVTKSVVVKNNTIVILPVNNADALYIPFLLDSLYVKGYLLDWSANVRKLSNVPIVYLIDSDKEYLCKLENTLIAITKLGKQRLDYEYFFTAERLLADLRDAIVFELYHEEYIHAQNIRLFEHWKQEVDHLTEKQLPKGFDELVALINSLLKPNNELYDNLKRFFLFVEHFKQQ